MREHAAHAPPPLGRIVALPTRDASVGPKYLHRKRQDQPTLSPKIPDGSVSKYQRQGPMLSHELAKMDVGSPKLSLNWESFVNLYYTTVLSEISFPSCAVATKFAPQGRQGLSSPTKRT